MPSCERVESVRPGNGKTRISHFSDDFRRSDDAGIGRGWAQLRGEWSLMSGTLRPTGGSGQMLVAQTGFELGRQFIVEGVVSLGPPGALVYSGIAVNIRDLGDGTQDAYLLTLQYGSPSSWGFFELTGSRQLICPAFGQLDVVAGRPYTLRATARRYGGFDIEILDGGTALVSRPVRLEPFRAQLAGGHAGLFSQAGNAHGAVGCHGFSARSSTEPSDPPPPPAPAPLVCTPAQGPPYPPPGTAWRMVGSSTVGDTQPFVAVSQALLTDGTTQYVAYYAADRQMTVAQRDTGGDTWLQVPLGTHVPDDGHNSVTLALDRDGQLHVVGNLHADPLNYFRTSVAGDITSLTRIASMCRPETEQAATYPVFLHDGDGALIYHYRDGISGNGATYYNIYDETTRTWRRLLDQPLWDGQGNGNAYPVGPSLGPDGYFHAVWVWRDTGDAATNHDVCYARTRDLAHWETVDGEPLGLPITPANTSVVVDPVPIFGGLTNNHPAAGFDADGTVLVSYYKLDENLNTQVYLARWSATAKRWDITKVSDWTGRYLPQQIGWVRPPVNIRLPYSYASYRGTFVLDPATLRRSPSRRCCSTCRCRS